MAASGGEGPGKRLDPRTWTEIQLRYEAGDRVDDLAEEYDVHRASIYDRAKREGWKRQGELQEEALSEARTEYKASFKERWREIAEKENENHYKLFALAQQVAFKQLKRLEKAVDKLKDDEAPGNLAYQFNVVQGAMRSAVDGSRQVLKLNDTNPFDEDDDDKQSTVGRLVEILEAGIEAGKESQTLTGERETPGDAAPTEAAEASQEALHADHPSGE